MGSPALSAVQIEIQAIAWRRLYRSRVIDVT